MIAKPGHYEARQSAAVASQMARLCAPAYNLPNLYVPPFHMAGNNNWCVTVIVVRANDFRSAESVIYAGTPAPRDAG